MSDETEWVLLPRELLEAAVCPMKESGCDGTQYLVQPHGEGEQCQWCYERRASLSAPQPPAEAQEVVCLECGQPTMPMGQVCYACSHPAEKPAEAQPVAVFNCPNCPVAVEGQWREPDCPECGERCFLDQTAKPTAPPSASVEDDPIDASDNAEYIEHCADRLERLGLRVTAGALRVIAHEHRALAQKPAAVDGATRRDAERYRFLRDNNGVRNHHGVEVYIDGEAHAPGHLDAQVDAALAAQQGGA